MGGGALQIALLFKLIDRKKSKKKNTFGIKKNIPTCLAITLVFALPGKDLLSAFHLTGNAHAAG